MPNGFAIPQHDHLGRLVPDTGAGVNLLRQRTRILNFNHRQVAGKRFHIPVGACADWTSCTVLKNGYRLVFRARYQFFKVLLLRNLVKVLTHKSYRYLVLPCSQGRLILSQRQQRHKRKLAASNALLLVCGPLNRLSFARLFYNLIEFKTFSLHYTVAAGSSSLLISLDHRCCSSFALAGTNIAHGNYKVSLQIYHFYHWTVGSRRSNAVTAS